VQSPPPPVAPFFASSVFLVSRETVAKVPPTGVARPMPSVVPHFSSHDVCQGDSVPRSSSQLDFVCSYSSMTNRLLRPILPLLLSTGSALFQPLRFGSCW